MKTAMSFATERRHIMIGMIITILLMVLGNTTAFAFINRGRLDGLLGGNIVGWAWNSNIPDTPAIVKVVIKKCGTLGIAQDTTLSAEEYRDDLEVSGKGTGKYGLTIPITRDTTDTSLYLVEYIISSGAVTNSLYCQGGRIVSATNGGLISPGTFKITACCPYRPRSSDWGGRTSTDTIATADRITSVDPPVVPHSSHVMINGIIYTAEDIGSGVSGKHVDIFFNTHTECRSYGVRDVEAFLVV